MAQKRTLFIYGTGGHAKVVADIVLLQNLYQLEGFIDDNTDRDSQKQFLGLPVRYSLEFLESALPDHISVIVAIGDTEARRRIVETLKRKGFHFTKAVHPHAVIASDVTIGEGTVVMAGAVINSGTRVGEHVIVNTRASVDHDCQIDDFVHVAPGAVLGGGVTVGEGSWIGMGALVREYKRIGAGTLVGMGSVVLKDVPDNCIVWGNPAREQHKDSS